jgi:hypothetical protein
MSVSALLASASPSSAGLVKLANGEYTAASVDSDPTAATQLDLVKENDGNYGTTPPAPPGGVAASQSSAAVLTPLASLSLGGE